MYTVFELLVLSSGCRSDFSSPSLLYSHVVFIDMYIIDLYLSMQLYICVDVENVVAVCMYNYHISVCVY